jgi:ubiquinone/menaquinone biosynthesis C-methylase UbiE
MTLDPWKTGEPYEAYVGRWSRLVARELLAWLDAPAGLDWLDVGCGTGVLTGSILEGCAPGSVAGIDSSPGFLATARQRLHGTGVDLREADARQLPFEDARFDRVVSGLVLNFVPEPERAAAEMQRVLRPGGEAAAYVWDYASGMELMVRFWQAAAHVDPESVELDEGRKFPLCRPEALQAVFEAAGLKDVRTRAIDVPTLFRDFDDYWQPFLAGVGVAPAYCVRLSQAKQEALRERLRASLPSTDDGSLQLTARAWAVRGRSG